MANNFKIRIFQPLVPEYRAALFDGIGRRYGEDVEIFASEGMGPDVSYPLKSMRYSYRCPLKKFGPFVWQRGLSIEGLSRGDVLVICGDVHQLSSLWYAWRARKRGIRIVWWGHHRTASSNDCAVAVRLWIAKRLSDVFLTYTRTGLRYLEGIGFSPDRVFATGNTIDQAPIKAAIAAQSDLRPNESDSPILLCCGVLRSKIHLEMMIKALVDDRLKNAQLVVIGDGPEKANWQTLAADLGVKDRVTWIPGTRNQMDMAPWFLKAKLFVYPGSIGLSILHSFSYALPVVTHGNAAHQMPEFEVMEDGKTGACFAEGDLEDMIDKISSLLSDEPRRSKMGRYCQGLALGEYTMDNMIHNFCQAIESAAAIGWKVNEA